MGGSPDSTPGFEPWPRRKRPRASVRSYASGRLRWGWGGGPGRCFPLIPRAVSWKVMLVTNEQVDLMAYSTAVVFVFAMHQVPA